LGTPPGKRGIIPMRDGLVNNNLNHRWIESGGSGHYRG